MFNKDFYPTTKDLILKMWSKLGYETREINTILEPSAGKGDIVDYLFTNHKTHIDKVDCIEIEPELQSILIGKGYNVVAEDFLNYKSYTDYDLIIMNPPFSKGSKHLLKAIEIQEKSGGKIICLLNAETIKNPYSNERKVLLQKLEQHGAKIDYIQNGFTSAQRKTGVETALIYFDIQLTYEDDDMFKGLKLDASFELEDEIEDFEQRNQLVSKDDELKFLVQDYNIHAKLLKTAYKSSKLLKQFNKKTGKEMYLEFKESYSNNGSINDWLNTLRQKYWENVMNVDTFRKYLTGNIMDSVRNLIKKQANTEFNLNNIYKVKQMLMNLFVVNLEKSAIDIFEQATKYHMSEYSKNIHLYNGWKTNKGHRLNKKIIQPINFYGYTSLQFSSYNGSLIESLEKVLNYFDDFKPYKSIFKCEPKEYPNENELENDYLHLKAYKKGTTHITFKRLDLLDKLNLFVGKKKNWIPDPSDLKTEQDKKEYNKIKKEVFVHFDIMAEFSTQLALPSAK